MLTFPVLQGVGGPAAWAAEKWVGTAPFVPSAGIPQVLFLPDVLTLPHTSYTRPICTSVINSDDTYPPTGIYKRESIAFHTTNLQLERSVAQLVSSTVPQLKSPRSSSFPSHPAVTIPPTHATNYSIPIHFLPMLSLSLVIPQYHP